ncbi:hypothetical protein [Paenibacillus bouchesdurhonensis]|uniref:hypothetical protein n=1 Tax=Paenibacillus bouchesdurhonensis TaxID=1870990 RepID=UPI000DA60424|nr:hypothetical protein [Paenibacillus bouchesdurhonensis]
MRKLFLGCTSIVSSVIFLCTGFLISALKSVDRSADINSGAFRYSIFNIHISWFIIPVILFIFGLWLVYLSQDAEK